MLGIGVSHAPLVERLRGHDYKKPYSYMKDYLGKMKTAMTEPTMYQSVKPKQDPPIVLAALHPKMLQLCAAEARGTHTYFVPPEHTAKARAAIGKEPWICAAQAVILETDPAKARKAARAYMKTYVPRLPNYTNNLKALGWKDEEFARMQRPAGRRHRGLGHRRSDPGTDRGASPGRCDARVHSSTARGWHPRSR